MISDSQSMHAAALSIEPMIYNFAAYLLWRQQKVIDSVSQCALDITSSQSTFPCKESCLHTIVSPLMLLSFLVFLELFWSNSTSKWSLLETFLYLMMNERSYYCLKHKDGFGKENFKKVSSVCCCHLVICSFGGAFSLTIRNLIDNRD